MKVRGCVAFISIGKGNLGIPSKLIKIRFDWGRPQKIFTADIKEETKNNKTGNVYADSSTYEQLW